LTLRDWGYNTSNNEIYSWHTGGANVLFGDGSVRFLHEDVSPLTVVALVTRASGEPAPSE
jgi:prepilin-type processing-associated H-X9-DG protein